MVKRKQSDKGLQSITKFFKSSENQQDVHTKATTTKKLEGTSDPNDCIIVNPYTHSETTPHQAATCTPSKPQVQTLSGTNKSSCPDSLMTASQASPFQKLRNPETKVDKISPTSPFQKIGIAETRTDKSCGPLGNTGLCGSLPGERDKTGLNANLLSPTVSLHKQASSGGSNMDLVKENASVGQVIRTVGNLSNDGENAVSKNPSEVSGGRFNKGDEAEINRQRILSGESQRYSTKVWPAKVDKKRHQSEDVRFKRESSSPLKHRESTDFGSASQNKWHSMHRSKSDSSQEITPESAQTYKEYREAKQRLLEKEKEEQSRRRSQQRLPSSSMETQGGGARQSSVQKTADSHPTNSSRGGQAGDSIDMVDSKFCIVYGADVHVPSPEDDGDRHSDLDIDLDLDDSDDELLEAPSFLKDLENAITQPVPRTPPPTLYSSPAPGSPIPGAVSSSMSIPSTSRFAKFSLDSLLEEHTNKPQEQREYEEMHAELKESVKQGGFVKDTLEKQDDPSAENLLPEHQEQIEHLEMKKSVICPAHPGETIFSSSHYQQLFTPSITPTMCGFSPGDSYIDKFLSSVQPRNFGALLSSEILVNCLEKVTHPKSILKWLLFLLSVDGSHLAMDGCCKALEEYLYTQKVFHEDENPWAPCVEDILSIFMNCGASKEDVLPRDIFKDDEEISSLSKRITRETNNGLPPPNAGTLNRENLRLVLQVLALALQRRPKYDVSHLTALYVMLCKVALDKSLNSGIVNIEVQSCLGSILCCYPESEWNTCAIKLCSILPSLTEHHHNKVYLASLSPYGRRGQFLQRRVSYHMLRQLFNMEPSPEDRIENVKIRDLHQFLPHVQQLVTSDMYKLYSCVTLIDLCVGNGVISPGEKDSLQYLSEQIKKISGDTRDDVRVLDRSRVKDQMVRLTSKWTLRLLTVGSNQRSIFSYTTSRAPQTLEIETVHASQTDESQSEAESDVEMEALDDEEP